MSIIEIFDMVLLGVGLSMDSLALSVSCGLKGSSLEAKRKLKFAAKVALIFALVQATTPIIGYFLGSLFADRIVNYDHWVAFVVLSIIGSNLLREGFAKTNPSESQEACEEKEFTAWVLFGMGIATSIDALAAGVTLAFIETDIFLTCAIIFLITFVFSLIGNDLGDRLGSKFQHKAEIFGGIILILLGAKILVEHLFF